MADTEPVAPGTSTSSVPARTRGRRAQEGLRAPADSVARAAGGMAATCTRPFGKAPGVCSTGRVVGAPGARRSAAPVVGSRQSSVSLDAECACEGPAAASQRDKAASRGRSPVPQCRGRSRVRVSPWPSTACRASTARRRTSVNSVGVVPEGPDGALMQVADPAAPLHAGIDVAVGVDDDGGRACAAVLFVRARRRRFPSVPTKLRGPDSRLPAR